LILEKLTISINRKGLILKQSYFQKESFEFGRHLFLKKFMYPQKQLKPEKTASRKKRKAEFFVSSGINPTASSDEGEDAECIYFVKTFDVELTGKSQPIIHLLSISGLEI
jgi:hypothetical protein